MVGFEVSFESKVPQRTYATTLDEQLDQLKRDSMMDRFAESRKRLSSDPYRPIYHYVNPEGNLNDPNGLCYWQGRYHLFYQAYPLEDPRQHWGHAVSDDLVRWRDLPLAIYPGIEEACYSGSTLVEEDRVIAMYHGTSAGNMVAISSDPLLLNWDKVPGNPVIPIIQADSNGHPYRVFDPCIWREEDGYYSLSGNYWNGTIFGNCRMVQHLFFSPDLKRWKYIGPFVKGDIFTGPGEDGAVPYFWPIGDRHILVFASHQRGSQYLLGEYDKAHHEFRPSAHGRFNFGSLRNGGVHAPSATPDGKGGLYVIHNINHGMVTEGWNHIMSLARRITLDKDSNLLIEPVSGMESLRFNHNSLREMILPPNQDTVIENIKGTALELIARIDPCDAREVCVSVLRSIDGDERTDIRFLKNGYLASKDDNWNYQRDALVIDPTRSSLMPDVLARPPEVAPFELYDDEVLSLRIFVDRSVVEVFANGRQCLALRVYPKRNDSVNVSICSRGRNATLLSLDAWNIESIGS